MIRLYVPDLPEGAATVRLPPAEATHLRVRRGRAGEIVELFDGQGRIGLATVLSAKEGLVEVRETQKEPPPTPELTVAPALLPHKAFRQAVRGLTEIGATQIVPLRTERSVAGENVSINGLHQVVVEAAKQCRRAYLPQIVGPRHLEDFLREARAEVKLFADPGGGRRPPAPLRGDARALAVGPEGGFSAQEREQLLAAGFQPISFPGPIMRAETAAVAIGFFLLHAWE